MILCVRVICRSTWACCGDKGLVLRAQDSAAASLEVDMKKKKKGRWGRWGGGGGGGVSKKESTVYKREKCLDNTF